MGWHVSSTLAGWATLVEHTHLGTAEDGDKGALWVINGRTKVVKLLLEKEASHLGRQVDAHHGAVSAMSSAEGIVDWRRENTRM